MENKQKLLNLLGLARRAGKLVTGEEMVLSAVRSNKANLVFFAQDGGASSKKKFTDKTNSYDVAFITALTRQELADATGLARTVIAVADRGFAKKMREYLEL
ncbi:YlxQ-related RNA-binding protein [Weissella muntiaci]|uniref:YlxQ-related RNA-binding protein n=1 Tax=Weissella muntiaci TaxID=2508881 RepID=A0A6C2CCC5_9LACO|nr:YlxQ-related RNA-binding protein [Weissella muntiaci]TYC50795.1 YlxQ-related RNA-binding protein [Weissella muntiaci]